MNYQPLTLPDVFIQNMVDIYKDEGRIWLDRLPHTLQELENLWQLEPIAPMPNLTYSYVAVVETKSSKAVLKLAPMSERLEREITWYRWQKTACPKLFNSDASRGALLLEYLQPGTSLKQKVQEGKDDEASKVIAELILRLDPPKITDTTFFPTFQLLTKI